MWITEHFVQFLQGTILGLDKVKVDDERLDKIPNNKDQIEVVADLLEGWSTAVLNNRARDTGTKVTDCSSLCSRFCGKSFGNVHALKRRPTEREYDAEEVDESDSNVRRHLVLFIYGNLGRGSDDGETDTGEEDRPDEKRASADPVSHASSEDGTQPT